MKIGRFVVDGHIHCGKKDTANPDSKQHGVQAEVESVDNSDMALYDMDAYGIDMGILLPSFTGTTNEMYASIVRKHPDRFRTCAVDTQTRLKAARGIEKWTLEASLKELDECFSKEPDVFCGVGEFAPGSMGVIRERPTRMVRYHDHGLWRRGRPSHRRVQGESQEAGEAAAHLHQHRRGPGHCRSLLFPAPGYSIGCGRVAHRGRAAQPTCRADPL